MVALHFDYFHRSGNNMHIPGSALDESVIRQQFQVEPTTNSNNVIQHSHSHSQGGSAGISLVGKYGYLGGSYHETARNYGIPPAVPGHGDSSRSEQEAIRIDMNQRRYDLEGFWKTYWGALPSIKAKLSYIDYDHKDFDKNISARKSTLTRFGNSVWESRLEMNHQKGDWLDGKFGMQWQNRNFSATGLETFTPSSNVDSIGFFLTETLVVNDRTTFELGGRIEHDPTQPRGPGRIKMLDKDSVSVSFIPMMGLPVDFTKVDGPGDCDAKSFYLAGDKVILCPAACDSIQGNVGASVAVEFACEPLIPN